MISSPDEGVGFEWFVGRAHESKSNFDENYRLGFEGRHRELNTEQYSNYIISTIFSFSEPVASHALLDIGAGGGELAHRLEARCLDSILEYVMVDAEEVLKHGFTPVNQPIYGQFPNNFEEIRDSKFGDQIQFILANSVLHYVKNDNLLVPFISSICELLIAGGVAYVGDVPTLEMKQAQAIANGDKVKLDSANNFAWAEFIKIVALTTDFACSLYVLPQPRWVPMHPHRSDLLIIKHKPFKRW